MGRNLRLGKHTPKKGLFNIVNDKREMIEGKIAADYMNQYCTKEGEDLSKHFKDSWVENDLFEALNKTEFSFNVITESVIKNILKLLPVNKSSCIEFSGSQIICDGMAVMLTENTYIHNIHT